MIPAPEITTVVGAVAFLLFDMGARPERLARLGKTTVGPRSLRPVVIRRLLGFVILGGAPLMVALIVAPSVLPDLGLRTVRALPASQLAALLLLAVLLLALLFRIPGIRSAYPTIQQDVWTRTTVIANAVSWALYLLAYEFCFRGYLLFPLADAFGPTAAVVVTTALYVFAHLRGRFAEATGSALAGPLFGWLALHTGAIWVPFLLHLIVALAADTFSLLYREGPRLASRRPAPLG